MSMPTPSTSPAKPFHELVQQFLRDYAWWIVKNVLGWVLILLSPILGAAIPGPGGIPVFLIGFALVTFPGKRGLRARVFRGRELETGGMFARVAAAVGAVVLPLAVAVVLRIEFLPVLGNELFSSPWLAVVVAGCVVASYFVTPVVLRVVNWVIRLMPRVRRFIRPMMRRKGIDLLPPRRRRRLRQHKPGAVDAEILEFSPKYGQQANRAWSTAKPWIRRGLAVVLLGVIFYMMLRPVRGQWGVVAEQIAKYDVWRFALATVMFAAFLFFIRCITWLKMIKGFGYRIPLAPGTRVWISGELARYLPGTIWQILGRVHLIKPYGVPASVCSTTQVLDIAAFLLANLLLGMGCLFWFWGKAASAGMQPYLIGGAALLPLLTLLLVPKVFYGLTNRVMSRLGKPAFSRENRLRGKKLFKYFFVGLLGLLFQSAALYVLLGDALHIKPDHWWKLAGPYCLAWCTGFLLGWWTPGGLGIRELVFVGMLKLTLDQTNREMLPAGDALLGFLVFCSVLMRLWTIAGELIVASFAYAADWKGAVNRTDAPGRVAKFQRPGNATDIEPPGLNSGTHPPNAAPTTQI